MQPIIKKVGLMFMLQIYRFSALYRCTSENKVSVVPYYQIFTDVYFLCTVKVVALLGRGVCAQWHQGMGPCWMLGHWEAPPWPNLFTSNGWREPSS